MKTRIVRLEETQCRLIAIEQKLCDTTTVLIGEIGDGIESRFTTLEARQEAIERYSRRDNIVVTGLPPPKPDEERLMLRLMFAQQLVFRFLRLIFRLAIAYHVKKHRQSL